MAITKERLEQHDAEIKKPLEDEIKRLKFESENIQKAIQHVDEAKYNAQQDDIEFFVKQAKQEVINELLEWINKNKNDYMCRANTQHISGKSFSPHMAGASITVYTDGFVDELKEKLNQMKGE